MFSFPRFYVRHKSAHHTTKNLPMISHREVLSYLHLIGSLETSKKRTHTGVCPYDMARTGIDYHYGSIPVKPGMRNTPPGCCIAVCSIPCRISKKEDTPECVFFFGDPYGNRTHVTAVKGRCLNRLTNGPGSGDLTRTGDKPGMNRILYQLSYAAIGQISALPKSASLLYPLKQHLSIGIFVFLQKNLEILFAG